MAEQPPRPPPAGLSPTSPQKNVEILRNGHLVSRAADYIIYSVEAAGIGRTVAEYGPCA
jgi:hypothetical protein